MSFYQIGLDDKNLRESNRQIKAIAKRLNVKPIVNGHTDDLGTEILGIDIGDFSIVIDWINNADDYNDELRLKIEIYQGSKFIESKECKNIFHAANWIKKITKEKNEK